MGSSTYERPRLLKLLPKDHSWRSTVQDYRPSLHLQGSGKKEVAPKANEFPGRKQRVGPTLTWNSEVEQNAFPKEVPGSPACVFTVRE